MSGVAGRTGPAEEAEDRDATIRVTGEIRRRLLTIQYQRKMAGDPVSFNDIIAQLLDRAGVP